MSEWDAFPLAGKTPDAPPPADAAWDAFPTVGKVTESGDIRPKFDSPEYVDYIAKKHRIAPDFAKGIIQSQTASSAVEGIPILGGLAHQAGAGASALAQPFTGAGAGGGSIGERYTKNKAIEDEIANDFATEHPNLKLASELIGGTAATLPLAGTLMGARALGLTGTTLPGQIAAGAASGAGINAADAVVRGNDPFTSAGVGAAIGGIAPPVARLAGAVARPIVDTVRAAMHPAEEAERVVASTVQRGQELAQATPGYNRNPLLPPEYAAAQQAGAPVNLMDMAGEPGRNLARSASNISPEGGHVLNQAIDQRFETQADRLTGWLRNTFHFPNADAQRTALAAEAQNVNRTAYGAAHQAAETAHPNGIMSTELERLTSSPDIVAAMRDAAERGQGRAVAEGYGGFNPGVTIENGMVNFRRGPTGVPTYPDLRFWDYTYRNVRDAADEAFRRGRNSEGNSLRTQANQLRDELDTMVPEFGQARAGAAHFFGADNALEAGENFVTSRLENGPARIALARMTPNQRQLFQDGYVDRFIKQINEAPDRRSILNNIANSPAQRERLSIALGPQLANELEAMLRVEGVMDLARGAVQGNSTTARQLAQLGIAGGVYTLGTGLHPESMDPASALLAALTYGAARGGTAVNQRVARQVAELLTSRDPARLANGMRILARNQNLLGALRHADVALARTGAAQAEPAQRMQ